MAAGRPRSFDEHEVLEQATQVFWAHGYEATSVAALERATGLGRQSLYNAFGGKRALFEACLQHYEDTRASGFSACLRQSDDPLAAIERLVRSWAELAQSTGCRGCLLLNTVSEFGGRDAALVGTVARVLEAQQGAIADTLRRAVERGQLHADTDPVALARRLQATSHGLQLMARLDPGEQVLLDVVQDTLASLRKAPAAAA